MSYIDFQHISAGIEFEDEILVFVIFLIIHLETYWEEIFIEW